MPAKPNQRSFLSVDDRLSLQQALADSQLGASKNRLQAGPTE